MKLCGRGGIGVSIIAGVISGLAFLFAFSGRYSSAGFLSKDRVKGINLEKVQLDNGIYTGQASGFRPGLKVEIEVADAELFALQSSSTTSSGPDTGRGPSC
jgi:hypothetical protein